MHEIETGTLKVIPEYGSKIYTNWNLFFAETAVTTENSIRHHVALCRYEADGLLQYEIVC